jgi:ribonuclease HII
MARRKNTQAQPGLTFGAVDGATDAGVTDPAVEFARALGGPVGGLDEAGRGPLAGPVVAACVVLPEPLPSSLAALDDSKKLDEAARELLFPIIQRDALAFGIAVVEARVIDDKNILRASLQAMADALAACEARLGAPIVGALLDGNQRAPLPARVAQRTLVGGDALSRPIMAASILAKVTRDRLMVEEHARWPVYGFDAHKGYGTPQHMRALVEHGPCPLHRRSFAPVRKALQARGLDVDEAGAQRDDGAAS